MRSRSSRTALWWPLGELLLSLHLSELFTNTLSPAVDSTLSLASGTFGQAERFPFSPATAATFSPSTFRPTGALISSLGHVVPGLTPFTFFRTAIKSRPARTTTRSASGTSACTRRSARSRATSLRSRTSSSSRHLPRRAPTRSPTSRGRSGTCPSFRTVARQIRMRVVMQSRSRMGRERERERERRARSPTSPSRARSSSRAGSTGTSRCGARTTGSSSGACRTTRRAK